MKFKFTLIILFATAMPFAQNNVFPSSGNVGIGTKNPSATLEVNASGINRSDGGFWPGFFNLVLVMMFL